MSLDVVLHFYYNVTIYLPNKAMCKLTVLAHSFYTAIDLDENENGV